MGQGRDHRFGGDWTEEKLRRLEKYLLEYMKIMRKNPKAMWFTTHYVDAFAGTGYSVRTEPQKQDAGLLDVLGESLDAETDRFIKGSTRRALEVSPPFHRYLFIEKKGAHCEQLHNLKEEYAPLAPRITIQQADANDFLCDWCEKLDRKDDRAVVFLDPYGMQVEWRLIEKIADTQAIDLWILFPLSAVMRMLPGHGQIPEGWRERLNKFFGTDDWEQEFYQPAATKDLFDGQAGRQRVVNFDSVARYFARRLGTVFPFVAKRPLTLRNDDDTPLFLLCFAAGNPTGGPKALRIAEHLLKE